MAANLPAPWFGNHAFRLLYAPDFNVAGKISFYQGDPYMLVLDVTDLVNPLAENRLELTNMLQPGRLAMPPPAGNLMVGRLLIRTRSQPSPMMTAVANAAPIINPGALAAGPARYVGRLLSGGGFCITAGSRQWEFASEFSYPRAGLNRLNRATPWIRPASGAGRSARSRRPRVAKFSPKGPTIASAAPCTSRRGRSKSPTC